jgi:pimeloyl-ACP methyl ester carboxylesterase
MGTTRTSIDYYSADYRLRLHAEECGQRNAPLAVLCLHGLTRNGRDFEALAKHLSARHRVITADQRGRGQSQWDPDPANYQIPIYAKDMISLLDRLEVARVVLIGTSMGGFISMVLGATQPTRVQGIVLNDIGPEVPADGIRRLRDSLTTPAEVSTWADAVQHAKRLNEHAFPDYGEADWNAFARRIYTEDATARPVPAFDPAILKGLSQASNPDAVTPTLWPLWEQLRSIPVLAIRGGLSDILSAEILENMAARHPKLTALTLPDRGHAPMLDEPAAVLAIDRFLESLQAPVR